MSRSNHWFASQYMAQLGLSVIPVGRDKKPLIAWKEYQTRKPTQNEIDSWYEKWNDAGIGIVTGQVSNLLVVDIDEEAGKDALKQYGVDWQTIQAPVVHTSKGIHIYFRHAGLGNSTRIIPGVDTRGEGGYVIAPPSSNGGGRAYVWDRGRAITQVAPPEIPPELVRALVVSKVGYKDSTTLTYRGFEKSDVEKSGTYPQNDNICQHSDNKTTKLTTLTTFAREGERDEKLYHVAIQLAKAKTPPDLMIQVLNALALSCDPPYDLKEIPVKVRSALSRGRDATIVEVREWIDAAEGIFNMKDIANDLDLKDRAQKKHLAVILGRLVKDGVIEKHGNTRGVYRRVEKDASVIDLDAATGECLPILFPLGLENLYNPMGKNIIIVAGESDSGKTAFLLNLAVMNADTIQTRYLSSEMGVEELRSRVDKFAEYTIVDFQKIDFRERSTNFADLILPDGLNIVDFLEVHNEFYLVGQYIKEIYDKLNNGVAVIAIQKDRGKELGRGASLSLEKARLYLSMGRGEDSNFCKIVKCKNWADQTRNPNGLVIYYKLVNGCKFLAEGFWKRPQKENQE